MTNTEKIYFLINAFDLWDEDGEFTFPDGSYIVRDMEDSGIYYRDEDESVEDLINSAGYWDRDE